MVASVRHFGYSRSSGLAPGRFDDVTVSDSIHTRKQRFQKASFSNRSTLESLLNGSVFGDRFRHCSVDDSCIRSKTGPFSFENGLVWTGPKACTFFRVLFLTPIFQVPIFLPQRFNYASNTNGGTDRQKLKQVRPIKGYRYGFLKNC